MLSSKTPRALISLSKHSSAASRAYQHLTQTCQSQCGRQRGAKSSDNDLVSCMRSAAAHGRYRYPGWVVQSQLGQPYASYAHRRGAKVFLTHLGIADMRTLNQAPSPSCQERAERRRWRGFLDCCKGSLQRGQKHLWRNWAAEKGRPVGWEGHGWTTGQSIRGDSASRTKLWRPFK